MADDDEWGPIGRPDEIATAEADEVKDKCKCINRDIPSRYAGARSAK